MTTFVSQRVASAPSVEAGSLSRAASTVREWASLYAGAFRASATTPRTEGMDPVALLIFGRS